MIAAVDAAFSGQIGYAANWDDYDDANLTATIWEHPSVSYMGVDTYVPLASSAQAAGVGNPSVALLETSWASVLDVGAASSRRQPRRPMQPPPRSV